jgi:hypothetical protein
VSRFQPAGSVQFSPGVDTDLGGEVLEMWLSGNLALISLLASVAAVIAGALVQKRHV